MRRRDLATLTSCPAARAPLQRPGASPCGRLPDSLQLTPCFPRARSTAFTFVVQRGARPAWRCRHELSPRRKRCEAALGAGGGSFGAGDLSRRQRSHRCGPRAEVNFKWRPQPLFASRLRAGVKGLAKRGGAAPTSLLRPQEMDISRRLMRAPHKIAQNGGSPH
jgi:hypothetical protein